LDLGIDLLKDQEGMVQKPLGMSLGQASRTQHMFTGIELTPRGIDKMVEFVATVREYVGYDVPLLADHFGHIGVNSCIRLGKALEKYNMAWLEDMVPWRYPELLKEISDKVDIPQCTGEDIYLKEGFIHLAGMHAVDILHPDLASSGGILETKKMGDLIQDYGVPMRCILPDRLLRAWRMCTAPRQRQTSLCWKIIPWISRGEATWSRAWRSRS
jgi:L-alanine-DL-glutamate epimerase-like enolase superfamily enzyme